MFKLLLLFSIALLALAGPSRSLRAQDFSGIFTVASPNGPMTLTLHQAGDGSVTGTLVMQGVPFQAEGAFIIDDEDEASIEGSLTGPQGRGDFTFYADEAGSSYSLLLTPYDASGTPRLDLAAEFPAHRSGPVDSGADVATTRQAPSPGPALRDARLAGVWATQVIVHTPNGSMTTQLFMELRADGTLIDLGSRSMGGFPNATLDTGLGGGGETAVWRTQGNVLLVSYAGSPWVSLAQFEVSGNRLLLAYYDGDRKLWYRQ